MLQRLHIFIALAATLLAATLPAALPAALAAQNDIPKPDPPPTGYTAVVPLWPQGSVPGAVGTDPVDVPKLYTYPATGPGPHTAVLLLPGGGYTHLVMEGEGGQEARWLQSHGVSAYVLQYRLWPRYKYPYPLVDGLRAMRLLRSHATDWHLNPDAIGCWGFSAGGHMAGYLATASPDSPENPYSSLTPDTPLAGIDTLSAHPAFAIISYGRVDLNPAIPGTFGMQTLIGPTPLGFQLDAVNPIRHVSADTSPTFLYATEHDEKVNSLNATLFFNALQKAGVPAELHVFELGPHGTHMGLAPDGQPMPKYPELAIMPILLQHWLQLHSWMPD